MSNKSGIGGQVLSLPSGGGAISGLGETFTADPFTGTGNVAVPIAVPPGRNGLQPDLTLRYSTSSGNGPFALGWSLDVPVITRLTAKGVPTYDDMTDRFVLAGFEQLVPVEVEPGRTHYRPRTEGAFA